MTKSHEYNLLNGKIYPSHKIEMMKIYRSLTCVLRGLNKAEYAMLREMCVYANNLYNKALYEVRQHFFATGHYLRYEANYHRCKTNENYKMLQAQTSQHVLKQVDYAFRSFFAERRIEEEKGRDTHSVRIPKYRKKNGMNTLIFPVEHGGCCITDGVLTIPQGREFIKSNRGARLRIKLNERILREHLKEIHIIPQYKGRLFLIQYVYLCEAQPQCLNPDRALAVDMGIDNLAACVDSDGHSFILDGRRIKSVNHYWNQQRARLQSVYGHQKADVGRKLEQLTLNRNNQVMDIMRKTARYILNYCREHDIGTLIVGNNPLWKQNISIGKSNTQNFVQIPHAYLRLLLKCHCERWGMTYIEQEESYTSKASFLDNDPIPTFGDKDIPQISGVRVKRGLYRSASGRLLNADINGAANILRKSKQNLDYEKLCRGLTRSPSRIRAV